MSEPTRPSLSDDEARRQRQEALRALAHSQSDSPEQRRRNRLHAPAHTARRRPRWLVALSVLYALAPIDHGQALYFGDNLWSVWELSLPLLAGAVGVLGGYASGRMRAGVVAGVLAGSIMQVMKTTSLVLLVVALWNALQHHGLQSNLQMDTQNWLVHQGNAPSLWTYLTNVTDITSQAFGLIFQLLFMVVVWPVPLIVGSALGAYAARRAGEAHRPETAATTPSGRAARLPLTRPIGFTLLLLVLGLLLWLGFTVSQGTLIDGSPPFLLRYLGASYVTSAFLAWLLAFLVILVAVYVTVRPEVIATPAGWRAHAVFGTV
ncbi:MAG: hypothetical protein ACLQUY_20525 [Ktedonobacterales bacterium]